MKGLFLASMALFAVVACTPQPSAPPTTGAAPAATPASYAAGSAANTTAAFDGTYAGVSTQNISRGNTLDVAGGNAPIICQDYGVPPPLSIHNGLAQFQLLNYTFQGYVTPQGHLKMSAGYGQTVEGQIDNQGVFSAQGVGACAYTATWRRSA